MIHLIPKEFVTLFFKSAEVAFNAVKSPDAARVAGDVARTAIETSVKMLK